MKCCYCKKEFIPKIKFQKYCTDACCSKFNKQKDRTYSLNISNKFIPQQIPKKCCHCNKSFLSATCNLKQQKFCSTDCKSEYHKDKGKQLLLLKRQSVTKICPICNNQFSPTRTMKQEYCSARCRNLFPKKIYGALWWCYKYAGEKKMEHTHQLLGYTPKQLQNHIQNHPNWKYVKDESWHLDHIFPIIAFIRNGIKDVSLICCLENLQPISGKKNCSKNDNYDNEAFQKFVEIQKLKFQA